MMVGGPASATAELRMMVTGASHRASASEQLMAPTVLVVDDDPERRLLEGVIRRFGYLKPVAVEGGEAARRLTAPDDASPSSFSTS